MRTLLGCGVAAAIAASFNTPVAGVIFTMEVVLMSYSITSLIPIIMASFCGTWLSRAFFGEEVFISIADNSLHGLWEIPLMVAAGLVIALFAALYIRMQLFFSLSYPYPVFWRIFAAGIITGSVGLFLPQILGLGYDTIQLIIEGNVGFTLLLAIALAKIITTSFAVGMRVPGGLIGPQLFIGACLGGMVGILGNEFFPDNVSNNGIYVLLGMAAMMGAVLNAPLAALMAVMELTYNPAVIFPSMLIIVVSCVATRLYYPCDGIFIEQLKIRGTFLRLTPLKQVLGSIGVRSVMATAVVRSTSGLTLAKARWLLKTNPLWVVNYRESGGLLLRAADLAIALERSEEKSDNGERMYSDKQWLDLLEIPAQRLNLIPVSELSNLYEARELLEGQADTALFVTSQIQTTTEPAILGIVTQDIIMSSGPQEAMGSFIF
ncbi:MAG: CIC family chloride channel protein [Cellvibrionaceae bacterium]|jgi:CIC family chloride channel protein